MLSTGHNTALVTICCQSIILGSVGQANCVAANGQLNALSLYRLAHAAASYHSQTPRIADALGQCAEPKTLLQAPNLSSLSFDEFAEFLNSAIVGPTISHMRVVPSLMSLASAAMVSTAMSEIAEEASRLPTSSYTVQAKPGNIIDTNIKSVEEDQRDRLLEQAPMAQRRVSLLGTTHQTLTDLGASNVNSDTPIMESGLDSLAVTELSARLSKISGASLSSTLAFEQPTPRAVVEHILELTCGAPASTRPEQATPSTALELQAASSAVVVDGVAIKLPGAVEGVDALAALLQAAGDAVRPVPSARWVPQAAMCGAAAMVAGLQRFDARFFGLSPAEVLSMDPQQRLVLELGYEALHRSSLRRGALRGHEVGVHIAIEHLDWQLLQLVTTSATALQRVSAYAASGEQGHVAAGRLSFALDLQGPSMSINTVIAAVSWILLSLFS